MFGRFTKFQCISEIRKGKRDDALFAEALNSLAKGTLNAAQVQLFKRIVPPNNKPDEAVRLFRPNAEVDAYNKVLSNSDSNKVDVEATDRVTKCNIKTKERLLKAAKIATTNHCQGLPFCVSLSLNTKYMI